MADLQGVKNEGESSTTVVVEPSETDTSGIPSVRMKLKKPKAKKKVAWTADTVDNENMDKKKSKCCCIYDKPKAFGESSSESDDECEHCKGHMDRKRHPPPSESSQEENQILPNDAESN